MLSLQDMHDVVRELRFEGLAAWEFHVRFDGDRPFLHATFLADSNMPEDNGALVKCSTRKWFLSLYMTKDEIVGTAMKCVLTAVEHEAREQFFYRNRAIYGPHISVDAMWEASERHVYRDS